MPSGEHVLNPQARMPRVVWSGSERHRMYLHLVMIIMVCVYGLFRDLGSAPVYLVQFNPHGTLS